MTVWKVTYVCAQECRVRMMRPGLLWFQTCRIRPFYHLWNQAAVRHCDSVAMAVSPWQVVKHLLQALKPV